MARAVRWALADLSVTSSDGVTLSNGSATLVARGRLCSSVSSLATKRRHHDSRRVLNALVVLRVGECCVIFGEMMLVAAPFVDTQQF